MTKRRFAIALAMVCVTGGFVFFLFHRFPHAAAPAAPDAVPVTAGTAKLQNVPVTVAALGTVTAIESVSVEAQVSGRIMNVFFTQGQEVKKDAPLFLIDPRPYQAALEQAKGQLQHDQAALKEAQADLARYQKLAAENSIARQQAEDQAYVVQQDVGTVQLDQANVDTATLNLAYCHIDAPADGLTGALMVDPGNNVISTTPTPLVTIEQIKPIYVSFTVPAASLDEIRQYQAKSPLEVDASSQAGKLLAKGKLTLINNQVNTATGTVMLEGSFDNPDEALWPGQFVSVQLTVYTRENAVTVPAETVMAGPDGSYVYVIQPDSTVKRVTVTVATRQDGLAVISKGLSGGEQVVTDGQYRLDDKVKVTIAKPGQTPAQTPSPAG
jgi:membrane fusion protein, multidrug efflux system